MSSDSSRFIVCEWRIVYLRIGRWLATGGGASLILMLLTAAAVTVIVADVAPRFRSPPFSLPLQQTLLYAASKPAISSITPGPPVELGIVFRPAVAGTITGIRFYRLAGDLGPHVGHVWTSEGKLLVTAPFGEGVGWQEAQLPLPLHVPANTLLIASYFSTTGGSIATGASFRDAGIPAALPSSAFRVPPAGEEPVNVYHSGGPGFPTSEARDRAFWIDVVFVRASAER
jgi:hypothetical protein